MFRPLYTKVRSFNGLQKSSLSFLSSKGKAAVGTQKYDHLLNTPATDVSTLPNGLRIASEGSHGETATVGVWIDAGSRYETEKNNGVAHFLEHMSFKGTTKRSQRDLEVEIENLGAHLNAYTSREQTVYYAKCLKNDVPKVMDILSDILINPTLDKDAINRERDVILREMQEVEKENEEVVFDRLHETAFQGSGLGRTILGPTQNILSINQDDIRAYVKNHYKAPRMVIAGAGAVNHAQLHDLAEKHFGGLSADDSNIIDEKAPFIGSDIAVREDDKGLAYIALAFESKGWTHPDAFPIMVMQTLLGCWERTSTSGANMASLLCNTVAELDLAHSVTAFNTCYKDTGLFGTYTVCSPYTVQDVMRYTLEAMMNLVHNVNDEQVAIAKQQLKTIMLSQLDGSSSICEEIGRQMLTYGRRMTPHEVFQRIDMVEVKDVRKAADDIFNDRDPAAASLGAIHEMPDYNWLRRRTTWLRV